MNCFYVGCDFRILLLQLLVFFDSDLLQVIFVARNAVAWNGCELLGEIRSKRRLFDVICKHTRTHTHTTSRPPTRSTAHRINETLLKNSNSSSIKIKGGLNNMKSKQNIILCDSSNEKVSHLP